MGRACSAVSFFLPPPLRSGNGKRGNPGFSPTRCGREDDDMSFSSPFLSRRDSEFPLFSPFIWVEAIARRPASPPFFFSRDNNRKTKETMTCLRPLKGGRREKDERGRAPLFASRPKSSCRRGPSARPFPPLPPPPSFPHDFEGESVNTLESPLLWSELTK